ncbi:MAG: lpsC [Acidimicrobiia bacterium]|nr:lpsC [Acidimicrobiia bacterium]
MIPFLDLTRQPAGDRSSVLAAVGRVLDSGRFLLGSELTSFEKLFAASTGDAFAVGVSSGAAALQLALRAVGVGPNDEVIIPAFTAVPTASAVCALGAIPVPVDVDWQTGTIDVERARGAVTSRTRAVVPVHLYGRPSDLPDIGVPIVEDAAQAHGAVDPGRSAATAYSFYPTKNLGGLGDGGAVTTADPALAEEIRILRTHGARQQYVHDRISQNFRLSEMQAAILSVRLGYLKQGNERRREIAAAYRQSAPHLNWQLPHDRHVYHLCVLRCDDRAAFVAALPCETAVHYPLAITQQPAYLQYRRHECPVAEEWAATCVSLPCYPGMTDDEVTRVATALAETK